MQVYIYSLTDPRNNQIRYIGKSINPKKRIDNHLHVKRKSHCSCWIQSLKSIGLKPIFEIIDIVEESNWKFWEQYWIAQIKAWNFSLTNHSIGGEGQLGNKQTKESNEKRSKALKGIKRGSYSDERKKSISEGMKGRTAWNKGKRGYKHPHKGRKQK